MTELAGHLRSLAVHGRQRVPLPGLASELCIYEYHLPILGSTSSEPTIPPVLAVEVRPIFFVVLCAASLLPTIAYEAGETENKLSTASSATCVGRAFSIAASGAVQHNERSAFDESELHRRRHEKLPSCEVHRRPERS